MMHGFVSQLEHKNMRSEIIVSWIESKWFPKHPDARTFWVANDCVNRDVLTRFDRSFELPDEYRFIHYEPTDCPVIDKISNYNWQGTITEQTGAYIYHFRAGEQQVEVLAVCAHCSEDGEYLVTLAGIPENFVKIWAAFVRECHRLAHAVEPSSRVVVVGGHNDSFVPETGWDEIILPPEVKEELQEDVQSFYSKGVDIYKRLNLKPFRKLLLAGVPGTGKTMLCSALAKWALEQNYLVIYVSSAARYFGDNHGSSFNKINHALSVAASSEVPALILLEELDAYLHEEEKALVLNVLDGSEAKISTHGTLLIATTNYPEAIDERVLKRPGRMDRIFIIPETKRQADAEQMLRQYLGDVWREEHAAIVPELIGHPGAFIREVAIYALTQMAYDDLTELSVEMLENSLLRLKDQIEARDDFIKARQNGATMPE